jgi:hypothetical protein
MYCFINLRTLIPLGFDSFVQVGALKGRVVYKGTLDALRGIAKERGLKGLYRGLGPSCLKLMPAAGLSFMCYEALKHTLLEEELV